MFVVGSTPWVSWVLAMQHCGCNTNLWIVGLRFLSCHA